MDLSMKILIVSILVVAFASLYVYADLANDLSDFVGFTIIASKTIIGWQEEFDVGVGFELTMECELARRVGLLQLGDEFPAKHGAEHANRNEKRLVGLLALFAVYPASAVGGDPASRDDGMNVGMVHQVLAPRVEHHHAADLGPQVLRLCGEFGCCLGGGPEQNPVNGALVLQNKRPQLVGNCENQVEVRDG